MQRVLDSVQNEHGRVTKELTYGSEACVEIERGHDMLSFYFDRRNQASQNKVNNIIGLVGDLLLEQRLIENKSKITVVDNKIPVAIFTLKNEQDAVMAAYAELESEVRNKLEKEAHKVFSDDGDGLAFP